MDFLGESVFDGCMKDGGVVKEVLERWNEFCWLALTRRCYYAKTVASAWWNESLMELGENP